jgi:Tol biopolymer transport system component
MSLFLFDRKSRIDICKWLFIPLLFQCTLFQRSVKISPVTFDYRSISNNYFTPNQSKPFPLTVQRGNNLFNSTTFDGRYLFYTTDQNGNYDIWFRDLQSSVVVPVTNSPFSESKPSISPDGRYLVYVSEEYDSSGDLVLLDMDIEEWKTELLNGNRFINQDTLNLTNPNARLDGKREQVIDTDPVWSPDGKWILFVTDRFSPGLPNLAKLNPKNPKEIVPLTKQGAVNPSFSKTGEVIYYISYKDHPKGEVYSISVATQEESQITNNDFLDFSPTIDSKGVFLYYSSIRKDTNGNGYLDERDTSYLVMRHLQTGKERILSSGDASFFDIRSSNFNGGSILFSAPYFNSINIYFIPESGSVPRQATIADQYQYTKVMFENQTLDSYFLGLDSIELFFSEDPLFPIYFARANALKSIALEKNGKSKEARAILTQMESYPRTPDSIFGIGLARFLLASPKNRIETLANFIKINESANVSKDTLPALSHILIDEYEVSKLNQKALELLVKLNDAYPGYHQIGEMRRRLGGYEFNKDSQTLTPIYQNIFQSWEAEKIRFIQQSNVLFSTDISRDLRFASEDLIAKIESNRTPEESIVHLDQLLLSPNNQKNELYIYLLKYLKAKALTEQRKFQESNTLLDSIIPIPNNIDLEPAGKTSIFQMPQFIAAYKNPIMLRANLLKYRNEKSLGNTSDALRNMKIYLEFYDPILGVDLKVEEIQNAFYYFENKALEFERIGNLLQSSFHYFFNNQNMFLVKTKNLYLETLYKEYAVYYQRKMVDTIFDYGKKLREEEERALINQLNILGKDKLNVIGNITDVTSIVTDNKYLRSVVDLKDLEKIEVLSSEALQWTELYYKQAVPRARPHLDLATLYGYAYFLINKYVIYESYYYATDTMTDARKKEILENYKKAEWELKWIIFAEPTYHDAYQLLGWLYQYIDLVKLRKSDPKAETDEEVYLSLYKRFFPEKNLEANVELYTQILVFLGEERTDPKIVSDLNLNLGNNHFLLNNYPKANESYANVEAASKFLLSKSQFENYRQEAVYHYNYGRALIYQGEYKKAIGQFDLSIGLYFKNEYYQAVNAEASDASKVNVDRLANVRSKLALLFSLRGLSELESQKFEEATVSFQTAIAYNKNINFVNPINLYNYLAIAFQKAGRFRDSYQMLSLAKKEYKESRPSFLSRLTNVSFWNFVLPIDKRVIGEGRFPGEFPDDFKYLLSLGVGIENHIEQREYALAKKELDLRNEFIIDKSLDQTIMGASILAKSKQIAAQIHYENSEQDLALNSFEELIVFLQNGDLKDSKQTTFVNYAASVFAYVEANYKDEVTSLNKLTKLSKELDTWKTNAISACEGEFCELNFRKSNVRYDILKGISEYYIGMLNVGETRIAHLAEAAERLENPGEVEPREVGLSTDPLRRKERIRLLHNLSSIYVALNDEGLAQKKLKEAAELAFEFRLDEELFLNGILKLEILLPKLHRKETDALTQAKVVTNELMLAWIQKPEIRLFTKSLHLDRFFQFVGEFYLISKDYERFVQLWEERRKVILFRQAMGSQFEFEDSKLNLAYSDLNLWIKKYKKLKSTFEDMIQKRENTSSILKAKEKEIIRFQSLLDKLRNESGDRSNFFDPYHRSITSFKEGWVGVYKSTSSSHVLYYQFGKLNLTTCEQQTIVESCLPDLKNESIFLQSLGVNFNLEDAKLWNTLLKGKGKQISFIFDRSHLNLYPEKNERNWKWSALISDNLQKRDSLTIRQVSGLNLGPMIYDTDVLISNKLRKFNGSLFGDPISEILPLREIFTNSGSEISMVGIRLDSLKTISDWNRFGNLYDVLRSQRIQNLVGFSNENEEGELLSGHPNLKRLSSNSNVLLLGNWDNRKSVIDQSKKVSDLIAKGFEAEKNKDFLLAYNYYYTASTLLENESLDLPELELRLARLKVELFPTASKAQFYEPLIQKYKNTQFGDRIQYDYYVSCYSGKVFKDCSKLREFWTSENSELYSKATSFYKNLRFGKVASLSELDNARAIVEKDEDPFLQAYRLGTLYIQNYMFPEAEKELNKSRSFAKTSKEKNIVKNRELEILFHKGFLYGDSGIFLTSATSTSAYSFGFRKQWKEYDEKIYSREFVKYGYADSIYDQYRKKLYESWKLQQNNGYFDPLVLTPEFLTTGDSVLGKLSHLNRTLMFSLLNQSTDLQKKSEVTSLIDLLIEEEELEKRQMRILVFLLLHAERLYLRGDLEAADKCLNDFESRYEKVGFGNKFIDDRYAHLKYRIAYTFGREIPANIRISNRFANIYPMVLSSSPDKYLNLLSQAIQSNRNELLSPDVSLDLNFLILHMLNQALIKNSSEAFFDIALVRDQIDSLSDRYIGKKIYLRDIPTLQGYSEKLKKLIPKGGELSAILDAGKKTYLLSFSKDKSSGRELFSDNKEISREILRYLAATGIGSSETLLRDSISDRYRNAIRLSKAKRHFVYLPGLHAKVPVVFPDTEVYFVGSIKSLVENPTIKSSNLRLVSGTPEMITHSSEISADDRIFKNLMEWEVSGKNTIPNMSIDYTKIQWNELNYVEMAGNPIGNLNIQNKKDFTFFANNSLGERSFYSNDYMQTCYYLSEKTKGIFVLQNGIQAGPHNVRYAKTLFAESNSPKPMFVRAEESKESARNESSGDRFWTGFRLFTSSFITED